MDKVMDSWSAMAMGMASRGKELMVFDWDKAAQRIAEVHPKEAHAGLAGDWEFTGGLIYKDGKPVKDDYTYLSSTWATPELALDNHVESCYRMQSAVLEWNSGTKWPASALKILEEGVK